MKLKLIVVMVDNEKCQAVIVTLRDMVLCHGVD